VRFEVIKFDPKDQEIRKRLRVEHNMMDYYYVYRYLNSECEHRWITQPGDLLLIINNKLCLHIPKSDANLLTIP
jgi:hypothetical protein